MSKKLFVLGMAAALTAISLTALAAPSVDTLLVQGYDAEEMNLVFGISDYSEDADTNCDIESGSYSYQLSTAELETEGASPDTNSEGDEAATSDAEKFTVTAAEVTLTDAGVECALKALSFDGEINHGRIVSSFAHAIKDFGRGKGCLMRAISGTDFGKTEKTDDEGGATASPTAQVTVTEQQIDLAALTVACNRDKGKEDVSGEEAEVDQAEKGPKPGKGKAGAPGQLDKDTNGKGNGKGKGRPAGEDATG